MPIKKLIGKLGGALGVFADQNAGAQDMGAAQSTDAAIRTRSAVYRPTPDTRSHLTAGL